MHCCVARVRADCWHAPLSRVGADAAVDLFSWNYVERVAGLMLEVSEPTWLLVGGACCSVTYFLISQRSTIVPDMVQDSVYFFVDPTPPQGAVPSECRLV